MAGLGPVEHRRLRRFGTGPGDALVASEGYRKHFVDGEPLGERLDARSVRVHGRGR